MLISVMESESKIVIFPENCIHISADFNIIEHENDAIGELKHENIILPGFNKFLYNFLWYLIG